MSDTFFYERHQSALRVSRGANLNFYAHLHREVEFFLLLNGSEQVTVDGHTRIMQPGEAVLTLPNRVHSYACPESAQYVIGILDMSAAGEYAPLLLSSSCVNPFLTGVQVHPDVWHCGKMLASSENRLSPALARAYVSVILGRLLEALPLSPASPSSGHDMAKDILLYINEHISEPISLDLLSRNLFINKYSISRIFSDQIGCSLHTYVNALRVELAQNLLRDLTVSTSELISRCGFESERTFYRAFRERCGMTPRQYRHQMGKHGASQQ